MKDVIRALAITAFASHPLAAQTVEWEEMSQGQTADYASKGDPKAAGLEVTMKVPRSWTALPGERPHVLVKFINPHAPANCNLLVRALPAAATAADLADIQSSKEIGTTLPDGATLRSFQKTKIDSRPAIEFVYSMPFENAGQSGVLQAVTYRVLYSKFVIQLGCTVGAFGKGSELDAQFGAYFPLFRRIANTMIIQNQWQ